MISAEVAESTLDSLSLPIAIARPIARVLMRFLIMPYVACAQHSWSRQTEIGAERESMVTGATGGSETTKYRREQRNGGAGGSVW
ncbi:hypothetical protein RSAG8_04780, partial [Rhizoctonia solani AG-8 WAC10335]